MPNDRKMPEVLCWKRHGIYIVSSVEYEVDGEKYEIKGKIEVSRDAISFAKIYTVIASDSQKVNSRVGPLVSMMSDPLVAVGFARDRMTSLLSSVSYNEERSRIEGWTKDLLATALQFESLGVSNESK